MASAGDFDVDVTEHDGVAVVALAGEVDLYTSPVLEKSLSEVVDGGTRRIRLDLGRLEFIDSTGIGVLVAAGKRVREAGGDIELSSPPPAAKKLLEIMGLTKMFAVVEE